MSDNIKLTTAKANTVAQNLLKDKNTEYKVAFADGGWFNSGAEYKGYAIEIPKNKVCVLIDESKLVINDIPYKLSAETKYMAQNIVNKTENKTWVCFAVCLAMFLIIFVSVFLIIFVSVLSSDKNQTDTNQDGKTKTGVITNKKTLAMYPERTIFVENLKNYPIIQINREREK